MAKTSVNCPNCRQPITIELIRLFDMNTDPEAKQKLLTGSANYFQCPVCQYQGIYPAPIVYHDPDKELLLTYFPPELNVPLPQQEQTIGPLIKKAVDDLPSEKRKAYIFKPQSMLTQQRLFERILEADGVTPEMLKAQQEKLKLIQTLAQAKPDVLVELIKQNDALIDDEFFMLLTRLAQASAAGGDEQGAKILAELQRTLIEHSSLGQKASQDAKDSHEALEALQELSKKGLTRENLLDLLTTYADNDVKLSTTASMARSGLDYQFFTLLTERIEAATAEDQSRLTGLRDKLLNITDEIDRLIKAETDEAHVLLDELLKAEKIEEATQKALSRITPVFGEVLNHALHEAQQANDEEKLKKLAAVITVIQSASASSAYMDLIEMLLSAPDEKARADIFEKAGETVNSDFLKMLGGLLSQVSQREENKEVAEKLTEINREALRFSMKRNLKNSASSQ